MKEQVLKYTTPTNAVIPAAVIAAGLSGPVAWSAPGDLDPLFGQLGRAELPTDLSGAVWSLASKDDEYLVAGGDDYCGYYSNYCADDAFGFGAQLSGTGVADATYHPSFPPGLRVMHSTWQKDGRLVGIGQDLATGSPIMFRLGADGAPDPGFGSGGAVALDQYIATAIAVAVDPDGRIVVQGYSSDQRLTLIRLMPDGTPDPSFGNQGVGQSTPGAVYALPGVTRTTAGDYRVLVDTGPACSLLAVTAGGGIDTDLGSEGIVPVKAGNGEVFIECSGLAIQPDGKLLVAGSIAAGPDVVRMSADGVPDPTFETNAGAELGSITAMTVASDGTAVVAGFDREGLPGIVVARLLANGSVDTGFGIAGKAWIDLPGHFGWSDGVKVIAEPASDRILVGGAILENFTSRRPFLVGLTLTGEGPGVLGIKTVGVQVTPSQREAEVVVRRTGGSAGAVSVGYRTGSYPYADASSTATAGEDFEPVQGRLEWAAGDTTDRTIVVPIAAGQPAFEADEYFVLELEQPEAGGLGTTASLVTILGDGYPNGAFRVDGGGSPRRASESAGAVTFDVYRDTYCSGVVSVTVTPAAGTAAAGQDFDATPITLYWADGECGSRSASIGIVDDRVPESGETLSVALSNPTGGAAIATDSSVQVTITDSSVGSPGAGNSGGGAAGLLNLLVLGLGALGRAIATGRRRRVQTPRS